MPVRKIEIVAEEGQTFDENKTEMVVKAYLYPADVSRKEVSFTATNDAGIVSNLAELEEIPVSEAECLTESNTHRVLAAKCCIRAKGDGAFRLRATVKTVRKT